MKARYCTGCGSRLRSVREDGRPRPRCPRCGWTLYNNPVPAAVAVIEDGTGRILLARRGAPPYEGTWDLPGGFLEAGEVPERALRRELREELGAAATGIRFLGHFRETYGPGGFPILVVVYAARLRGIPRSRSDVSEVRWFQPEALPFRQIRFPAVREALKRYLRDRPKTARSRAPIRSRRKSRKA
jgi:ADP-ribose pyrophosphatase YjhB (NUDIX family)